MLQGCRKPRSDLIHFADHLLRFASPTRTNTRTKASEHVIHDAKKEKKSIGPFLYPALQYDRHTRARRKDR